MEIDYNYQVECLKGIVSKSTYEEFVANLKFNNAIIEDDDEILDFDFENLTATIHKSKDRCFITGVYDCYDDDGQWIGTIYREKIDFRF